MTLNEVLELVRAGYSKEEIAAFVNPPAAPAAQTTPAQAFPVQQPAAVQQPAPVQQFAQTAQQPVQQPAAQPVQPMYPSERPAVTLADVMTAVNSLASKITAPNPAFTEPAPLGLSDMVSGFLGVKGGSSHA